MLRVGLVGTGYAAQRRAESFLQHPFTTIVAVAGNTPAKTMSFSKTYGIPYVSSWQDLIEDTTIDLVCISNVNKEHGTIVRAALQADKHVIVEYPLTIYPQEADELLQLARSRNKLLHVEHIEILGGVHQAIKKYLPEIGEPFLARYSTITLKSQLTPNWTFNYSCYGYPFIAAVSRITRFTDLFGKVDSVTCYSRFWDSPHPGYFSSCYCQAQLSFKNGILVCLTLGKGDEFKSSERVLEIYGNRGTLKFEGEKGKIIRGSEETEIEVAGRRGLFYKDTEAVIDYLTQGKPLYFTPEASIYALKVAEAIQKADQTKSLVFLP